MLRITTTAHMTTPTIRIWCVMLCIACAATLVQPHPLHASPAPRMLTAADQPLVIIRFNQDKVVYKRSLYRALTKALDANPEMVFDVVAFSPTAGDPASSAQLMESGHARAAEVINNMRLMGLPDARISLSQQASPQVDTQEVHIFVR